MVKEYMYNCLVIVTVLLILCLPVLGLVHDHPLFVGWLDYMFGADGLTCAIAIANLVFLSIAGACICINSFKTAGFISGIGAAAGLAFGIIYLKPGIVNPALGNAYISFFVMCALGVALMIWAICLDASERDSGMFKKFQARIG